MQIELVKSDFLGETNHYTFQLSFDNRAFSLASLAMTREEKHLPISASVLFEIFPFCIVFGWELIYFFVKLKFIMIDRFQSDLV